VKVVILYHLKT